MDVVLGVLAGAAVLVDVPLDAESPLFDAVPESPVEVPPVEESVADVVEALDDFADAPESVL